MREAEHAADETTHAIVKRVNSTFVTPFDREDIYALASGLDDVMDMMDEAVDMILLYEVKVLPAELSGAGRGAPALRRADRASDAEAAVDEGASRSTGSRSTGSRTPATRTTGGSSPTCSPASYKAMEVLKLKDIVESLEGAIDAFEKVANIVEQIAVKES